ncbi:hypothetical protein JHK85_050439 [Glycine max]|nr:hypothetical protein JHK85_050439 [Glycine max]
MEIIVPINELLLPHSHNSPLRKVVKAMVEEDPNVLKHTTGDDDKLSPLHVAAANSQVQTPLMYAAKQGKTDCVEKLINAGANIFMLDSRHGGTCLYDAAFHGRIDCLEAILFAAHFTPFEDSRLIIGSDICSSCGGTPLHMAALGGSLDCIRILLARGADRLQLDFKVHRYQNTPYTVALEHQHKECAALLGPSSAPLVWPYQLKFISELDQEAKALVEVNMPPSSLHSESNNDNIASKGPRQSLRNVLYKAAIKVINVLTAMVVPRKTFWKPWETSRAKRTGKSSSPSTLLIPGCGNFRLSEHLYDAGHTAITNIDFSKIVISDMLHRNVRDHPLMRWRIMDMTAMQFEDESFGAVIDKVD